MSSTNTSTYSYSVADIEIVMRKVTADLIMIASSTGALEEGKARQYAHDIEVLAKFGYLRAVDLTLLDDGVEKKAARYDVSSDAANLNGSRPGGVLWPRYAKPHLRVTLFYTDKYTDAARQEIADKLKIKWVTSYDDTSHANLSNNGSRSYTSNSYGMQRKDYGE